MSFTRLWRNAPLMTFSNLGRIWELTVWAYFGCQNWRHILCRKTFDCCDTRYRWVWGLPSVGVAVYLYGREAWQRTQMFPGPWNPSGPKSLCSSTLGCRWSQVRFVCKSIEKREQTREKYSTLKKSPENAQKNNFRMFFRFFFAPDVDDVTPQGCPQQTYQSGSSGAWRESWDWICRSWSHSGCAGRSLAQMGICVGCQLETIQKCRFMSVYGCLWFMMSLWFRMVPLCVCI